MKKIVGIFKESWFLSLVGVMAIALLVFFGGEALEINGFRPFGSLHSRYISISSLSLGWVLYHAWQWLRNRKKNKKILASLVGNSTPSPEEQASIEELRTLQEDLHDALKTLESIHSGKKSNYLYQTPWYVIIGPPGAGKTTLLANSKLNFPLSEKYGKDALRGVGGTRNCDWWFTEEAILLDTAGRYTTQDSRQEVDHAGWFGFLDLLKKTRPQQPINGILVAVSITDLLQQTAEQQENHANTIRKRIHELYEQLGVFFPVYMIFTKCDLLSGFSEFFDDLTSENRDQVWGVTFPYQNKQETNPAETFADEFVLLEERTYQQLVEKLGRERSLERRHALYLFPQQLSLLKPTLTTFLNNLYKPSRYQKTPLLRGVYFTSATQEGSPIDRIMAALTSNYGIGASQGSRFSEKGKSFFINHLLQQVVFSESGLAGTNPQAKKRIRWIQTGIATLAILLTTAVASILLVSYFNNKNYIMDYEEKIKSISQKISNIPDNADITLYLKTLDEIRKLSKSYADQPARTSLFYRFGLNQIDALGEKVDRKYEDLLRKIIRPYAKSTLEQYLRKEMSANPEKTFNALKVYLFFGGEMPKNTSIEVNGIDWNNDNNMTDPQDQAFNNHLENFLKLSTPQEKLDNALVTQARIALEKADITKIAYNNFIASVQDSSSRYNFDILKKNDLDVIGQSFIRKSNRPWSDGVPGIYTRQGYEQVFLANYLQAAKDLANDAWVINKGGDLEKISTAEERLFEHYQLNYIEQWDSFLSDITGQSINNRDQAKQIFLALTKNGGNLLFRLIQEIQIETQFKPKLQEGEENKKAELTLKIPEKIQLNFSDFSEWDDDTEFQDISRLIDEVSQGLNQDSTFEKLEDNPLENAIDKLDGESEKLPVPIRNIIKSLTKPSKSLITNTLSDKAKENLKALLKSTVGDLCTQQLLAFPAKKNSNQSIKLADFSRFFQPGGIIDTFEQQLLKEKNVDEVLKESILKQFSSSKKIRNTFFSSGFLNVDFGVELLKIEDPSIESIELSIGALTQRFEPGKITRKMFSWPASDTINAVITKKEPQINTFELTLHQGDSWGIFKFVENDILQFPLLKGVKFKIYAPTPTPFHIVETTLRGFKCPTL